MVTREAVVLSRSFRAGLVLSVALFSAGRLWAADWPQVGYNAQKSNASPEQVNGPYRYYWRSATFQMAARAQPVIVGNVLFIGSLNGTFYAIDADHDANGGDPLILWQRDLGSPVRSGAGVDTASGTVIVGTQSGQLYGLEASTSTIRWRTQLDGAVVASPLLVGGTVYLGTGGGALYAIRASDGVRVWVQAIGAPVLGSAAASVDGAKVYFVAENMRAYGLNANGGTILWTTLLRGQSATDRWPVVVGSNVVFMTQSVIRANEQSSAWSLLSEGDDILDSAGAVNPDWAADWSAVRPRIVNYLTNTRPGAQTVFVLNADTGASVGVPPVLRSEGGGHTASQAAVYGGNLYLRYRPRHGIQTNGGNGGTPSVHVSSRYDAELGLMDMASLDIAGLTTPDPYQAQWRMTSDEEGGPSFSGSILLVDSWERLGGIRLTGPTQGPLVFAAWLGSWGPPAGNPFFSSSNYPIEAGEGGGRPGAAVGAGRIFWKTESRGLAAIGPAAGGTGAASFTLPSAPPLPPIPAGTAIPDAELLAIVRTEPARPFPSPPADMVRELENEISRIVAANGHLIPFYLDRGLAGTDNAAYPAQSNETAPPRIANNQVYWYDPGELVYTLSLALPYVNSTLRTQLRSYIAGEIGRYSPLSPLPYGDWRWLQQGVAREPFPLSGTDRAFLASNMWPPAAVSVETLYGLWVYAKESGDWAYVTSEWSAIRSLFNSRRSSIDSYAEVAGAIGYARIARQLGQAADATDGEAVAVAAMRAGLNLQAWLATANRIYDARIPSGDYENERPGRSAAVFYGLTPEVGEYLRRTNLAAVEHVISDVTRYPEGSSVWYATRAGLLGERTESTCVSPELAWSLFLTHAFVRRLNQTQLRSYMDRPWGLGDLYHIQKLVAVIEAPVGPGTATAPGAPQGLQVR